MPDLGPDFRAALDAIARQAQQPAASQRTLTSVTVLGAGLIGQLLAAEALAAGLEVRLYSAFERDLEQLRARGTITVRGRHLEGSYAVTAAEPKNPAIRLSTSIDEAVAGTDLVLLATPATAHPTYAGLLARALADAPDAAALVLIPGRFLGSVEMYRALSRHGAQHETAIAETSTVPYLAREAGGAIVVDAVAARLPLARLGGPADAIAALLAVMLPGVATVPSVLDTAFAGVTGVAGVAPVILNSGASQNGHSPLWRELVTPHLSGTILRDLDQERREVGFAYGVRDLPSAAATLAGTFGTADDTPPVGTLPAGTLPAGTPPEGDDLAAALGGLSAFAECRLADTGGPHLSDDVPNMLVPLASAGRRAGIATPATDAVAAIASVLAGTDFTRHGRRLETLGLDHVRAHDLRHALDTQFADQAKARPRWRRI